MSVDSLNRPPTLFTISSSFRASIIAQTSPAQKFANVVHRLLDGYVDDLMFVLVGQRQLVSGDRQPALDRVFLFGAAGSQPSLEFFKRVRPDKDGHRLGILPEHLAGAVDVDL